MFALIEAAIVSLGLMVAATAMLFGASGVPALAGQLSMVLHGEPVQAGELALQVVSVTGPLLLGSMLLVGGVWHLRSQWAMRRRVRQFPEQPWLWRTDWAAGMVRLSNTPTAVFTVLATAFYVLVLLPLGAYLASLKNPGLVWSFLAVTGLFLLIFMRILWASRRWNRSTLAISTLPGKIGGSFSGVVTLSEHFPVGTVFRVALRCDVTRSTSAATEHHDDVTDVLLGAKHSNTDVRSTTKTTTLHEQHDVATVASASPAANGTVLPVSFNIPLGLPSSGDSKPGALKSSYPTRIKEQRNWFVQVKADSKTDLREVLFTIPVFAVD